MRVFKFQDWFYITAFEHRSNARCFIKVAGKADIVSGILE